MALRKLENGEFHCESMKDVKKALAMSEEISEAIRDDVQDSTELRKAAARYLHAHGKKAVTLDDGQSFNVITRFTRTWLTMRSDIPKDTAPGAISLKDICGNREITLGKKKVKLFSFITKRVADPEKIDEAVNRGYLTEDEIADALLEKPHHPFVQRASSRN